MSYDMTLGNGGYGLGGSSGLGGFLGNLGNAWQSGLSNNLRMATDLYNFTNKSLTDPSYINAIIGKNNVAQQQNQSQFTDLYYENQMKNALMQAMDGKTLRDFFQSPQQGGAVVNTQSANNQVAQTQTQPVNKTPSSTTTTAYAQQQQLGPYRSGYQFAQPQNTQPNPTLVQQMMSSPQAQRLFNYSV